MHIGRKLGYLLMALFFGFFILAWARVASIGFQLQPNNIVSINPLMLVLLSAGFALLIRYRNRERTLPVVAGKPLQLKRVVMLTMFILGVSVVLLVQVAASFGARMVITLWASIGVFILVRQVVVERYLQSPNSQ